MALLPPPYDYITGADGIIRVLQIEHLPLSCSQDGAASGYGLALVETARWLHPEDLGRHGLNAGNAGGSSHQLDCMEGDGAISGLERSHGSSDVR